MFFRSSVVGDLIGLLPGAGATIASFVSYGIEARFGKRKNQMGTGVAEGIVAPQAAATASVGGSAHKPHGCADAPMSAAVARTPR